MSDIATTAAPGGGPRPKYKRKLSNYLLDKKLQLRYVLLVTILSGVIAGALGYLIYQQKRAASESIEKDLQALTHADAAQEEADCAIARVPLVAGAEAHAHLPRAGTRGSASVAGVP